jgi:hypothetical protein
LRVRSSSTAQRPNATPRTAFAIEWIITYASPPLHNGRTKERERERERPCVCVYMYQSVCVYMHVPVCLSVCVCVWPGPCTYLSVSLQQCASALRACASSSQWHQWQQGGQGGPRWPRDGSDRRRTARRTFPRQCQHVLVHFIDRTRANRRGMGACTHTQTNKHTHGHAHAPAQAPAQWHGTKAVGCNGAQEQPEAYSIQAAYVAVLPRDMCKYAYVCVCVCLMHIYMCVRVVGSVPD